MAKNKKLAGVNFGKRLDLNVSIQPYIETECFDGRDHTILRFDIEIDKEHINQYEPIAWFLVAEGTHWGGQTGTEWEALQLRWQKQYDYLKEHLQRTVGWSLLALCGEAGIGERDDWNLDTILAEIDLGEIEEWSNRHTKANDKSGAWDWGDRFRFPPHNLVLLYARYLWDRLKGIHRDNEDEHSDFKSPIGSFFEKQHQKVLEGYAKYAHRWKAARSILRAHHPPDEKAQLLKEASGPELFWRFPDDLLDSLRETVKSEKPPYTYRLRYRPGQIALVHLARDAWLLNKDGSRLRAHQWQSIRRAINKYSSQHKKPQLKIQS